MKEKVFMKSKILAKFHKIGTKKIIIKMQNFDILTKVY